MNNIEIATNALGYGLGFIVKEVFCFTSINAVRTHLQQAVNNVARSHFNFLAAALMGSHLSTVLTVSVTCFIGDMIFFTVVELVSTISYLAQLVFKGRPVDTTPKKPLIKELAIRVFQYAIYFFTRTLICNSAMPLIRACLDFSFRVISVFIFAEISTTFMGATWAVILTPHATFLLAEVIGAIVSVVVKNLVFPQPNLAV